MKKLATIEKVEPREVWPDEAKDFTPWLRANIEILSGILGLDLEIDDSEANVGDFYVDLVGKDLGSGRSVVIENQLGQTDHDHLGKLLTYAAGRQASISIWISRQFRDEHRQALDWLNSISGEGQLFFGIEIRVIRIGDSLPAPDFAVVAKPNDWGKHQRTAVGLSEKQEAYREFFDSLIQEIRQRLPGFTAATKGQPTNWYTFPAGRTGFAYTVSFAKDSKVRVELSITTGNQATNKRIFDALASAKEEIERAIGSALSWERLDDRQACRIAIYRPGSIGEGEEALREVRGWMVEQLAAFQKAFKSRIKQFKID